MKKRNSIPQDSFKPLDWLLVDMSSLLWYCLKAGRDTEFGQEALREDGKKVWVNGWQYGLENAINSLVNIWSSDKVRTAPHKTVLVYESGNTKGFRRQFLDSYKGGPSDRAEEEYNQFNLMKEALLAQMRDIGVHAMTRAHMEGDDLLAYLCSTLKGRKVVQTQDGDLCVLLQDPDVTLWRNGAPLTEHPYGPFNPKYITLYKALVGDTSDKIPGAPGFGPKSWLDFHAMFGEEGMEYLDGLVQYRKLEEIRPNVADLKALAKVVDNPNSVYASYDCAKLYPDVVESFHVDVEWTAGYVKQKKDVTDERLAPYAGTTTLIHAGNYEKLLRGIGSQFAVSPFVALDIETSTPEESDDWLRQIALASKGGKTVDEDDLGVDVRGSELTGMSLTFGPNMQHTIYMTVDHVAEEGVENLTVAQVLAVVQKIRKGCVIAVHNASFELPVLYGTWGHLDDRGDMWHGFLPNVHDTMMLASYYDENSSRGLKKLTKRLFDYDQTTYAEVTGGRKMNQLTAREVLAYGADDTIMTAGLYAFFQLFTQAETTWDAFLAVEVLPAYVTALAFHHGFEPDLERLRIIREEDAAELEKHERVLNDYLIANGWEGTQCPVFTAEDLEVGAKIKEMYSLISGGEEFKSRNRLVKKLCDELRQLSAKGELLASLIESGDVDVINKMVAKHFDGRPKLDSSSPRQMRALLYDVMGLKPRMVNGLTDLERETKPELKNAIYAFNSWMRSDQTGREPTPEQWQLIRSKASADKYAVFFALEFDVDDRPELKPVLQAIQNIAIIRTRFSLFYNKYPLFVHWKTGRVHPHLNQCATNTRRYSSSAINVQQMSKKGEGVKVRGFIRSRFAQGWIVSEDFNGQELRLGADLSKDPAMLACYLGDDLKDIHSIMASHPAMLRRLGDDLEKMAQEYGFDLSSGEPNTLYRFFRHILKSPGVREDHKAMADDLRKLAKSVVFGTQYDAMPPTLARQLISTISEAAELLEAKQATFPVYDEWKSDVVVELKAKGYVTSYMGARRHLKQFLKADKWTAMKAERQGPNYMIQGSGAEQTKKAMGEMWLCDLFFDYQCIPIAPIHDEMVVDCADEDMFEVARILNKCMTTPYLREVPEVSSISFGRDFGAQFEACDGFDLAAMEKTRAKILEKEAATA